MAKDLSEYDWEMKSRRNGSPSLSAAGRHFDMEGRMRDLSKVEADLGEKIPGIGNRMAEAMFAAMRAKGWLSPDGVRAVFGEPASSEPKGPEESGGK